MSAREFKTYLVLLYAGNMEEPTLGCLAFHFLTNFKPGDGKHIAEILKKDFLEYVDITRKNKQRACCKKQPEKAVYCSICGRNLAYVRNKKPEPYEIANVFSSILREGTMDSYGDFADFMDARGWRIFSPDEIHGVCTFTNMTNYFGYYDGKDEDEMFAFKFSPVGKDKHKK